MKLLNITVGGFCNITRTTIECNGMVALVSPNNYGKTNLLIALHFAYDFISASPKARTAMMSSEACVPLVPTIQDENFLFEIILEDPDLDNPYRFIKYGFEFVWIRDDKSGCRIINEVIETSNKLGNRWTTYLKRAEGCYRKSYDTRSFRKIALDDNQLAIDVLTALEDIDINPVIHSIKQTTFAFFASLEASNRFNTPPFELNPAINGSFHDSSDDDLPRALFHLKEKCPEKYDEFCAAVLELFPEFEDIFLQSYELKPEDRDILVKSFKPKEEQSEPPFLIKEELYRLMVKSKYFNQTVSITHMSDGTQRLIWLVASVIIANVQKVCCTAIEEIETSIHPKMLKSLLESLNDNIGSSAMFMTSHSPYLIQYLKPECIYIGVPRSDGVATFKRIRKGALKEVLENAHDLGMGFGEYLFELMSSDEDSAEILCRYLED